MHILAFVPSHWPSLVAQTVKSLPTMWETWVQSLGLEDSLEKKSGNLLQDSCLGNLMDSGAWQTIVHGVCKELDTTERLSLHFIFFCHLFIFFTSL